MKNNNNIIVLLAVAAFAWFVFDKNAAANAPANSDTNTGTQQQPTENNGSAITQTENGAVVQQIVTQPTINPVDLVETVIAPAVPEVSHGMLPPEKEEVTSPCKKAGKSIAIPLSGYWKTIQYLR